jgi:hypothetical protein
VHRQLGLLAAQLGQSQHAAEHFEEAIARHADAPAPALEARTRCDYAVAMSAGRAAGSIRDARRMAAAALELAEACGATRLTERVRALMPAPALAPR